MTEYDYSEEGARRFADTIARIGHWSHLTASTPRLTPSPHPLPPHLAPTSPRTLNAQNLKGARGQVTATSAAMAAGRASPVRAARSLTIDRAEGIALRPRHPCPPPADGTLAQRPRASTDRPAARRRLRHATTTSPGLPATATTATVLPRPALARVLPPAGAAYYSIAPPGQYAPQPQPQTHHRSRSSSYALPPAQQMGMPMPMPQPGPGQPVRTRSYSFQAAAPPPPQPVRASTYPYPAPPPGSGQKGYVYHPSPGYAPPGPSPGYSSAPALQMHPALFNQPQRSPTKEVPLLKRVFGFGGGGGRGRGVASRDTSTRESSRDTSGRESRGSGSRRESRDGNGKGRSTSRGRT
ncbi:hypothetical protein B0H13DRAFT_2072690, partial [Mycena leptocephala]